MPDHPEYLQNAEQAQSLRLIEWREIVALTVQAMYAQVMSPYETLAAFYTAIEPAPTPGAYSATREYVLAMQLRG